MVFHESKLKGVWLIALEARMDERGYFARTYCENEFRAHGLNTVWPQCNMTLTVKRGMLRGLHYQTEPKPEIKLVRCDAGSVFDVVVDLRKGSPTFGQWEGFQLRADKLELLYIPGGFAHGFQCLEDNCRLFYQMSEFYYPELARGVRWDDPGLNIKWPIANPQVSARDAALPFLEP